MMMSCWFCWLLLVSAKMVRNISLKGPSRVPLAIRILKMELLGTIWVHETLKMEPLGSFLEAKGSLLEAKVSLLAKGSLFEL